MPVYPAKLPESIRNDPKRTAELKLYDYFKENLQLPPHDLLLGLDTIVTN